jgi:hypothetical protein
MPRTATRSRARRNPDPPQTLLEALTEAFVAAFARNYDGDFSPCPGGVEASRQVRGHSKKVGTFALEKMLWDTYPFVKAVFDENPSRATTEGRGFAYALAAASDETGLFVELLAPDAADPALLEGWKDTGVPLRGRPQRMLLHIPSSLPRQGVYWAVRAWRDKHSPYDEEFNNAMRLLANPLFTTLTTAPLSVPSDYREQIERLLREAVLNDDGIGYLHAHELASIVSE